MAVTQIDLDRQAKAKTFAFGTTSASGEATVTINKGTAATSTVVLDVKGSASVAGDLNVTGDIKVTGAIDSVSVTNTNVKDKTITLNDGGTTAGAAGGGLIVEGDSGATIGALTYALGSSSKFQIGDGTTQYDVLNSNSTLTGSKVSGNIAGNAANVTGTVAVGNGGTGATTLTGLVKGNGTSAMTAATAGTDYTAGTSALATGILKNTTGTGAHTIAVAADFPTLNQNTTGNAATATAATTATSATTATTATAANGLNSATTTVVVNGATAPTAGQVLTATSSTAAVWSAPGAAATFKRTTITGTLNGVNTSFTLGNTPLTGSEMIVQNGLTLNPGGNDYTLSGTTVTFTVAPQSTDTLLVWATY
jgi:hypothetical protein